MYLVIHLIALTRVALVATTSHLRVSLHRRKAIFLIVVRNLPRISIAY